MVARENVGQDSRPTSAAFANGAIACFAYSALALVLLHLLRPDYAPATNFISNYAVGPYGWIMTTWFLFMSCGLLTLAIGLYRNDLRSVAAYLGQILLVVASIGLVVSAIYPTDVPGAPATRSGDIHDVSFLVNVGSIFMGIVLLSWSFGNHSAWRSYRRTAWTLTALILLGFVVQFLTLHQGMPYGLANRFFVVVLFAWLFAVCLFDCEPHDRRLLRQPSRVARVRRLGRVTPACRVPTRHSVPAGTTHFRTDLSSVHRWRDSSGRSHSGKPLVTRSTVG